MNFLFHPLIYVRGYAMSANERDETAADPFCGFNSGSTVYRATSDKKAKARVFFFESPVLRLSTEFGYRSVFENGIDIMDPEWKPPSTEKGEESAGIPMRSIIIYRYYDDGSNLLGDGKAKDISTYAQGLANLILRVRHLVVLNPDNAIDEEDFRCNLIAHSMGGLVVRALLQNKHNRTFDPAKLIDKIFTYATPHDGIEMAGVNIPSWLTLNEINNFSRKTMSDFLGIKEISEAQNGGVAFVQENIFPIDRIFCMVGTNRSDYEVAQGLSRTFAGHGSDGLVRIENATLWGVDDALRKTNPSASAYAYRSHSGFFGLVNCEESFQNLTRFLFGDVRVDIWVDIDNVSLPSALQNQNVEALYLFELRAGPRGKRWYLTRRLAEEDSPACRTHTELTSIDTVDRRSIYLSTVFLSKRARVNRDKSSLAYAMHFGVRTPDYEVNKRAWLDEHFEGAMLFEDSAIVELCEPEKVDEDWLVKYYWLSDELNVTSHTVTYNSLIKGTRININFSNDDQPGIRGNLCLLARLWNS